MFNPAFFPTIKMAFFILVLSLFVVFFPFFVPRLLFLAPGITFKSVFERFPCIVKGIRHLASERMRGLPMRVGALDI